MSIHHKCKWNCGGTGCTAQQLSDMADPWLPVEIYKPKETGEYEVRFKKYSDDIGRYNRGFLGLPWLCYWSDEKYGLREVTHWRKIN